MFKNRSVQQGPILLLALMAASGEYTDLVDAGVLIDLTDLIDKYGPNIKKVYGDYFNRIKYSHDDSAIYTIPTNLGVDHIGFDAQAGFEIQRQTLEKPFSTTNARRNGNIFSG
ncbi:UNVERIFIED_CONTAM: ABC-type glycerol-3-phosphate transport system substrate-binding protein [Paenibacillus sp. PvR008]